MPVTGFEFPSVTLEQSFRGNANATPDTLGVLVVGEAMYTHKDVQVPESTVAYDPDASGSTKISVPIPGSAGYDASTLVDVATLTLSGAACAFQHESDVADTTTITVSATVYTYSPEDSGMTYKAWKSESEALLYTKSTEVEVANQSKAYTDTDCTLPSGGSAITAVGSTKALAFNGLGFWIDFGYCIADGNGYVVGKSNWPTGGVAVGDPIIILGGTEDTLGSGTYKEYKATVIDVTDAAGLYDGMFTRVRYALDDTTEALDTISGVYLCKGNTGSLEVEVDVQNNVFKFGPLVYYSPIEARFESSSTSGIDFSSWWKVIEVSAWNLSWSQYLDNGYGVLNTISDTEDLISTFGSVDISNGLALACWYALAAGANPVYWTAIDRQQSATPTLAYVDALEQVEQYSSIYSVVVCSTDADVIKACAAYCNRISSAKYSKVRRALWYGIDISDIPGAGSMTNAQLKTQLINMRKARTNSYRSVCVWADDIMYNGSVAPNYVGAASAAGMRAAEQPHRPISNMGYDSVLVRGTHKFKRADLRDMGAEGIWIIANNEDGLAINMKQVTTAVSNNINENEESVVANADTIAMALCHAGENYVGKSNINPVMLATLQADLNAVLANFTMTTGSIYVGPQIIAYEIQELYQDPVNLDHVIATIECTVPKPFNRFRISLAIV